tara:strand:- start:111 stop:488 length:378 start_codon:yes stop_codon:yes gene_type:complete
MEFIATLIVLSCSGTGTQTDIYNDGTRDTTASDIVNKRIVLDKDASSVVIDGKAYESTFGEGDVRVNFAPQYGSIRDFSLYIRLADGHYDFEWGDSLPLLKDPDKRRRLFNLTGWCEIEEIKKKK